MQAEQIEWRMSGWVSGDWREFKDVQAQAYIATTFGVVIRETEREIVVAPHVVDDTGKRIAQHVAGDITIPRDAIISRLKLQPVAR
jgi:hypothetical protein